MVEIIWALSLWYLIPSAICLGLFIWGAFEDVMPSFILLLISAGLIIFGLPDNTIHFNWYDVFTVFVYYIIIGLFWSFFKYFKMAKKYKLNGYSADNFKSHVTPYDISCWVMYWPFSITSYIIGDIFVDFINFITKQFKGVYNRILLYVFKD